MTSTLRLKNVEIILENDQKVFQMGENVHGKVVVTFTGELPLSALQIGVVCMSKIKHADETFDQKKLFESFFALPKSGKSTLVNFTVKARRGHCDYQSVGMTALFIVYKMFQQNSYKLLFMTPHCNFLRLAHWQGSFCCCPRHCDSCVTLTTTNNRHYLQ